MPNRSILKSFFLSNGNLNGIDNFYVNIEITCCRYKPLQGNAVKIYLFPPKFLASGREKKKLIIIK